MSRIVIKLFLSLTALLIIAAIGVSLLIANIDLNRIKPQIQQLVYDNSNVALVMNGPIDWVFDWHGVPSLSISISETRAYIDTPLDQLDAMASAANQTTAFANIEQFTFGVSLRALLKGKVNADELSISGLALKLSKDKQGRANWEAIGSNSTKEIAATQNQAESQKDNSATSLFSLKALSMDVLRLSQIKIQYDDLQNDQHQLLNIDSLTGTDVNLQGTAFPLDAEITLQTDSSSAKKIALSFNSDIALNGFLASDSTTDNSATSTASQNNLPQQIVASNIDATVSINYGEKISGQNELTSEPFEISGNASYLLQNGALLLDNININSQQSKIGLSLKLLPAEKKADYQEMELSGTLSLNIDDIQAQLNALGQSAIATADSEVLKSFTLNADIAGKLAEVSQSYSLANIRAELDSSKINGAASVLLRDKKPALVSTNLSIDTIDLDRYLAPDSTASSKTSASAPASTQKPATSDTTLPLTMLDIADVLATLTIEKIIFSGMELEKLETSFEIAAGDLKTAQLQGEFYESNILLDASLLRKNKSQPILKVEQMLDHLNVAALIEASLKDDATNQNKSKILSGVAKIHSSLNMRGDSIEQWKRSLTGTTQFTLADGIYHSDNVERRVCQAVALVRNTQLKSDWPTETTLENVSVGINWQKGVGQIDKLNGGLKNIDLGGSGTIDLLQAQYSLELDAVIKGLIIEVEKSVASTADSEQTKTVEPTFDTACRINEKYRDIKWPLVCKGSLTDSDDQSGGCEVDRKRLNRLIEDYAKQEVKTAIEEKIEETIEKELGDKLDDGIRDLIKGGLEGLFK